MVNNKININDIWMFNTKCYIVLYNYANKDELNWDVKRRYKIREKYCPTINNEIVDKEIITNFLLQERLLLKTVDGEIILSDCGKNILKKDILPDDTYIHTKEKLALQLSWLSILATIFASILSIVTTTINSKDINEAITETNTIELLKILFIGITIIIGLSILCYQIYTLWKYFRS